MKRTSVQFVAGFILSFATLFCHSCRYGYYGSGPWWCTPCPPSTYKDFAGNAQACTPCPLNSGQSYLGSVSVADCKCFTGYNGAPQRGRPCVIRNCQSLVPPLNGVIVGNCNRQYLSVCRFQCNEGYEIKESELRQCNVLHTNVMGWSGYSTQCSEIRCPITHVVQAKIPSGTCRAPDGTLVHDLIYKTVCFFECNRGCNLVGNQYVTCQLDKQWSPAHPTCEEVRCPKLPSVPVGTFSPPTCAIGTMRFDFTCALVCPSGYHIHPGDVTLTTDVRRCNTDGSWEYRAVSPTCRHHQYPIPDCPDEPELYFNNDPGKNVSTVTWSFDFTDNSLAAGEPGVTKDSFTVTLKIGVGVDEANYKVYDTSLPKLLGIGQKTVQYTVTDLSGNSAYYAFSVVVWDTEPPTCSFCPPDIVIENATSHQVKVTWNEPTCSDNSGQPVSIETNRNSGDLLDVPGSYDVQYQVTDGERNTYKGCSFRITLKGKTCPMYAAPKNGALVCNTIGDDLECTVMCKNGYDFVFNPPLVYYCSLGKWQFYSFGPYATTLPWPDCSKFGNPSIIHQYNLMQYFFDGDANGPNVQDALKDQFLALMTGPFIPPFFCKFRPCPKDSVSVFLGEEECDASEPLGMESGQISNASITGSSYYVNYEPWKARLNARRGKAWYALPSDTNPWIQVNLGKPAWLKGVATQGKRFTLFVKTFKLAYSSDAVTWFIYSDDDGQTEKVFTGNTDPYQAVTNKLAKPVYARYLRLIPQTFNNGVALRLELYGCFLP